MKPLSLALPVLTGLAYLVTIGPIAMVVLIAFSPDDFFEFPPTGWSLRWFEEFFRLESMRAAFSLSILLALGAATLSTAFSAMAALWVVRHPGWWSGLVQGLFLAPLIFPAIILGVALLLFYKQLGIPVLPGLIIGHVLVGLPYSFRVILVSLHSYDLTQEEASASLGAGPLRTFLLITLPQIWPGVIAGWFFAFIESFGNINISLFLSGPGLATLPVEIFAYLQFQGSRLVIAAASALQILLILVLLIIFGQLIGVDRVARTR